MASIIVKRVQASLHPLVFLAVAAYGALLVFLEIAVTFKGTSDILSREKLSDRIFGKVWLRMNALIKKDEEGTNLPSLDGKAYGTVVELGPGSGNQLSRYNKSAVTKIYGIEPNVNLHPALRQTIKETGLADVYTIVPCGIEDFDMLRGYGIMEGSIDTVMSVQVLCSVPRPEIMTKAMYRLLKPGGQMIVYEHVRSEDPISKVVQVKDIYGIVWPYVLGNCHLDRPTGQYLATAGKWEKIEMTGPQSEDAHLIVPRVQGRLVKADSSD